MSKARRRRGPRRRRHRPLSRRQSIATERPQLIAEDCSADIAAISTARPKTEDRIDIQQLIAEEFGHDVAEWWHPGFEPHEGWWTAEARDRQAKHFERGYKDLRRYPRGMRGKRCPRKQYPRPTLGELSDSLPYVVNRPEARALARILLGLGDPRTPKDIRKALKVHVRDIARADGLLYEARPSKLPARPTPKTPAAIRQAFGGRRGGALRRQLRDACRRGDADNVLALLRQHFNLDHQQVDRVREAVTASKGRALAVVEALDPAISEASARRLLYGG